MPKPLMRLSRRACLPCSEAPAPVRPAVKPDLPEDATELDRLMHAMETAGWVQAKAARLLNMTPRQIGYALRKHNIPIKRF